ncbi:MAG TPA: dTDP-glucose 4,6-dehydratase [Polyangiales bacterium]|jgi:dTDP-glucose 4,6-dehydratase|nr:dTDP-glucose 4,6-dehydratase [Polyangiales bacterium]
MKIIVTGGAGFIGANFLNRLVPELPDHQFINLDKLTYAANLGSLRSIDSLPNYGLRRVDITDMNAVDAVFDEVDPDLVVHFAAESHVDRSILGPREFIRTNIEGTFNLLEACRKRWSRDDHHLFHHVSTDEVYGSLGDTGLFEESTSYDPSSPYSASKAASDHIVRAYHRTYGLPIKITNCSNNYGPMQFPEKLIPLMILNALERKPLPIYGKGLNVRDWLYVSDHCDAIWTVIQKGRVGRTYNVGGNNEMTNIEVVDILCRIMAEETGSDPEELLRLKQFVTDRPGHDLRYAIDASRIREECGWEPKETFDTGIRKTVQWYLANHDWVADVRSGDYRKWMDLNYGDRTE